MVYKMSKWLMLRQNRIKNFAVLSKNYSMEQQLLREDVDNGRKTIFTINRPEALNALTFKIVEELYHTTKNLEKSQSLLIIKAAESKAYCTGADLKHLPLYAKLGDDNYINNYSLHLNVLIDVLHTCKIPVVAFVNGFVFGSGCSIAVFPKYNIVTENTVFCMPEVRIGSVPNGGSSYFFNNYTKGKLGYYLALTGEKLKGTDLVQAGIFKYYTESKNLKKIENELVNSKPEDVKDIIEQNCEKNLPELSLTPYLEKIDHCFSEPTVEGIISKLKEDGSKWALKTVSTMEKCSPLALKVLIKGLQRTKNLNLRDCLTLEHSLGKLFQYGPDIKEGIRFTLEANKDGAPKWSSTNLSEVTDDMVEHYFTDQMTNVTEVQKNLFKMRETEYW